MKLSEGFLGLLCVSAVLWNGYNAKPHVGKPSSLRGIIGSDFDATLCVAIIFIKLILIRQIEF